MSLNRGFTVGILPDRTLKCQSGACLCFCMESRLIYLGMFLMQFLSMWLGWTSTRDSKTQCPIIEFISLYQMIACLPDLKRLRLEERACMKYVPVQAELSSAANYQRQSI